MANPQFILGYTTLLVWGSLCGAPTFSLCLSSLLHFPSESEEGREDYGWAFKYFFLRRRFAPILRTEILSPPPLQKVLNIKEGSGN